MNDTVFTHSCSPLFVNLFVTALSKSKDLSYITSLLFHPAIAKAQILTFSSSASVLAASSCSGCYTGPFFLEKLFSGLYSVVNSAEAGETQPCFLSACLYWRAVCLATLLYSTSHGCAWWQQYWQVFSNRRRWHRVSYQIHESAFVKVTEILLTKAALWCVLLCQSLTKRCGLLLSLDPGYSLSFACTICFLA